MAPQGYVSSGDGYSRRFDKIIEKFERKTKITDDTALWDVDLQEHWWRMIDFLELVGKHGIVLNADKFQFCEREVDFAGFRITENRVEPLPKYLEAIETFPTPTKLTDVRSWFGLINQVAHYNQLGEMMAPFRPLLSSKAKFYWSDELQEAFTKSKKLIIEAIRRGVEIFELSRPTKLQTDWSTNGIGYYLSQKHCTCPGLEPDCCDSGWRITLAGSRFLKAAETGYAPIEGECLGAKWALEQTRYFTLGCDPLIVVVDHKPLCGLLNDKSLEEITNARLVKMKEKMLKWKFTVIYRPGKKNFFSDFASRNPRRGDDSIEEEDSSAAIFCPETSRANPFDYSSESLEEKDDCQEEISLISSVSAVFQKQLPFKAITWNLVKTVSKNDEAIQQLMSYVVKGFPEYRCQLPESIQEFWIKRDSLYVVDNVLMAGSSVVIPYDLRSAVLEILGSAHQGVVAMKMRAGNTVYWPGIGSDIESYKKNCSVCRQIQPSQVHNTKFEPRIPITPFQSLVADYFDLGGSHYLVIADRLSGWPEIIQVKPGSKETGARALCKGLSEFFARFGVPADISTDQGPEYMSQFTQDFFKAWGIVHKSSSSYFAASNGRAELAVKACKRLLRDNVKQDGSLDTDKFVRAMLTKRNTPDNDSKLSPAEIIMGRKLTDALPCLPSDKIFINNESIHPRWREMWHMKEQALRDNYVKNLEPVQNKSGRSLKPLAVGQHVALQNQRGPHPLRWDRSGVIVMCMDYDQYIVKVHGSNRLTRRNRRFLRAYDPPTDQTIVVPTPDQTVSLNRGAVREMGDGSQGVQVGIPQSSVQEHDIQIRTGDDNEYLVSEPRPILPCDNEQWSSQAEDVTRSPIGNSDRGPGIEGVRRSGRSNKGESTKFKDFLTGNEYEKGIRNASKD